MAALRRANGRDEPWRVRFWGLGNEPWGCGGGMRPEAYADLARVFGTYSRDQGGLDVEFDVRGARVGAPTATVLTADALNAHNTPQDPQAVRPKPFDAARFEDGLLRVQLPPHAFVTVKLPLLG